MKKILMIGPFPPPLHGQSISNKMLREGLKQQGLEVEKINTNTVKKFENLKNQGSMQLYKICKSIFQTIKGFVILFRKFDVIYLTPSQTYYGFKKYMFFMKLAIKRNIPFYFHIHGGYFREMYESLSEKKQQEILKIIQKTSGAIVLGNSLKKMFEGLLPEGKIFVCENGVEKQYIATKQEIEKKMYEYEHNDTIKILYLSNLMESKGILDLLEACKIMKENNIKFHLDVAGNIEPIIKDKVEKYLELLKDNATYHGIVSGKKKKELFLENYIFVLPTYYPNEGQPISILEAYANGCAVVTTNHGGIKDIFEDGKNGYYCEKNNPENLKEIILETHKNYKLFSNYNFYFSMRNFSEREFIDRMKFILDIIK